MDHLDLVNLHLIKQAEGNFQVFLGSVTKLQIFSMGSIQDQFVWPAPLGFRSKSGCITLGMSWV